MTSDSQNNQRSYGDPQADVLLNLSDTALKQYEADDSATAPNTSDIEEPPPQNSTLDNTAETSAGTGDSEFAAPTSD